MRWLCKLRFIIGGVALLCPMPTFATDANAATLPYQFYMVKDRFNTLWCSGMVPHKGFLKNSCRYTMLHYNTTLPDANWKRAAQKMNQLLQSAHSGSIKIVDRYVVGHVLFQSVAQRDKALNILNTLPAAYTHNLRLYTQKSLVRDLTARLPTDTDVTCSNTWHTALAYNVVSAYTLKKCSHTAVLLQTPAPQKARAIVKKAHKLGIPVGIVHISSAKEKEIRALGD